MKARVLVGLAMSGGAMILCDEASAKFQGLAALYEFSDNAGHDIYRVYAEFTNSSDGVVFCGGNGANALHIQTRNADDSGLGTNFFNPGGASANTAPNGGAAAFGTFVTIGISDQSQYPGSYLSGIASGGSDETRLSPGFPNFIANSNDFLNTNIGWYVTGPVAQAYADYINEGNDTDTRVLIMQLAVNHGEHVRGTLNIGVFENGVVNPNLNLGETFYGVPAAGSLSLLGVAALVVKPARRRRKMVQAGAFA